MHCLRVLAGFKGSSILPYSLGFTSQAPREDTAMTIELDGFTSQYIETALWSSHDESNEQGGDPFNKNYTWEDIHKDTLAKMAKDCEAFQKANRDDIATWDSESIDEQEEQAAHDFWLTRNGHGAGFGDGDWGEDEADRLSASAESYGEFSLYLGDDGMIHGS